MKSIKIRLILVLLSLLASLVMAQTSYARLPTALEVALSRIVLEIDLKSDRELDFFNYSQKSLDDVFQAANLNHSQIVQTYLLATANLTGSFSSEAEKTEYPAAAVQDMINTVFFIKLLQAPDVAISEKKVQTKRLNKVFLNRLDTFMGERIHVSEREASKRFSLLSETLGSYHTPEDEVIARDLLEQWTRLHALPNRGAKRAFLFPFKFIAASGRNIVGMVLPFGWGTDWSKYGGWAVNAAVWAAVGLSYEAVHLHSVFFAVPAGILDFVFGYLGVTNSLAQATRVDTRYSPAEAQDRLDEAKKLLGKMNESLESDCTLTLKQL